jgi:hypothetical protein
MMNARILAIGVALAGALLAGCSTPAPVRDLASRGAATVGLAEAALRDYVATSNNQLEARMNLLRDDAETLERERLRQELDNFYTQSAGLTSADDGVKLIERMALKRKEIRDKQQQELARIAAENTLDPDALAKVPAEKLTAARKSFAVLSEELSSKEWITLMGGYAKVISDGMTSVIKPADTGKQQ